MSLPLFHCQAPGITTPLHNRDEWVLNNWASARTTALEQGGSGQVMADGTKQGPPASLPADLMRNDADLALAVSAAAFLVKLLDHAAGVGGGGGDGAGQERQGDEG